jgi:hypothetical protein
MADEIKHPEAEAGIAMLKHVRPFLMVFLALACVAPVLAAGDPTIAEVYEAADSGHLDQAQQMMSQVLKDHPQSAKAHYVEAELYARGREFARARQELDTALRLQPGMQFANPESVRALQAELVQAESAQRQVVQRAAPHNAQERAPFPLRTVLLVLGGICVLWLIMRRRTPTGGLYSQYPSAVPTAGSGPVSYGGPGMGSGIAGGLASGLAVGAGVVAGEQLAHHFLDGNRSGPGVVPAGNVVSGAPENADMGGSDFGVSDANSWDDNSGSVGGDIGGGGDDWT